METVYRDYSPKGVKFFFVYKALAHPETNGYITPFTLEERLMHVKEAERRLGSKIPWICDTMSNDLKHALGDAPNSEFIIDSEGKVVVKRNWSKPDILRKDLEKLVGPIENPTKVADLNLKTIPPPKVAATGVVKRIEAPSGLQPLKVEPLVTKEGQPFYVKLRAEADRELLQSGKGKLYLGFLLDPIYHVHWNNLTRPIRYEITTVDGTTVTPNTGEGPKVKAEADIDPREFLVDVETDDRSQPIEITVKYFACNDEESWCKAVTQQYTIRLEQDRDGGRVRRSGSSGPGRFAGRLGPGRPGDGNFTRGRLVNIDTEKRILTIMTRDREQQEFRISKETTIMRDRKQAKFADLKKQDRVMLRLAENKEGDEESPKVLRIMARSGSGPFPGSREKRPPNRRPGR